MSCSGQGMFLKVINLCRIMPEVLEPRAWLEVNESFYRNCKLSQDL
jgi:hypothetical protein